jgi:hypothetical protein
VAGQSCQLSPRGAALVKKYFRVDIKARIIFPSVGGILT